MCLIYVYFHSVYIADNMMWFRTWIPIAHRNNIENFPNIEICSQFNKVSKFYCHYLIENVGLKMSRKKNMFLNYHINLNIILFYITYITLFSLSDILMYIKSKLYKTNFSFFTVSLLPSSERWLKILMNSIRKPNLSRNIINFELFAFEISYFFFAFYDMFVKFVVRTKLHFTKKIKHIKNTRDIEERSV